MSETNDETTVDELPDDLSGDTLGPAVLASVGSVALALYYYYVRGDKQRGQFIGLWPATILGLAIYLRLGEILEHLQNSEN
ncbi:MAG: hypothetical protein V5A55_08940 [Halovenus sp.]